MNAEAAVHKGSTYPASLLTERAQRRALIALCVILGGMLALPMVPGWQGLTRVLAATILFLALPGMVARQILRAWSTALLLGVTIAAVGWIQSAASNPGIHVIGMVTDIYGLAIPLYAGVALTLVDGVLLGGLALLLLGQSAVGRIRLGYAMALFVWAYSLSGPVVLGIFGAATSELMAQMLAGSSEWAGWVLLMGLCLTLVRGAGDIHALLSSIVMGGLAMALVMALQFAMADYAYVLDTPNLQDYFYRVRGTAYYHAPATYTVSIALMLTMGMYHAGARGAGGAWISQWIWPIAAIGLATLAAINDTRALNVALITALTLMVLIALRRRDWSCMLLTLALAAGIGADIIYVKSQSDWQASAALPDAAFSERVQASDLPLVQSIELDEPIALDDLVTLPLRNSQMDSTAADTIVGSNSVRLFLAQAGLNALPQHLFVGSGVGTLELYVGGLDRPNTTYSTHILYLDMALMAGVPALVVLLALLLYAFCSGISASVRRGQPRRHNFAPAMLCASVVLGLGAVFLPQERNHIPALFFVFSGLLLAPGTQSYNIATSAGVGPQERPLEPTVSSIRLYLLGGVFSLIAIGWGVLTSSTYMLPALNLVGRHASAIAASNALVYVTEPATVPLVRSLLRLGGVNNPQVAHLLDSPEDMPQSNSYVIWSPARDVQYSNLRTALGYRLTRPGSDAPSLETPPNWWMLPVIPYAGYLLFVGARPAGEVFAQALDSMDVPADMPLWPNAGRFIGFAQRGEASSSLPRVLLDANSYSSSMWLTSEPPEFYFDMSSLAQVPLAAYRLVPPTRADYAFSLSLSWRLQGSEDLQSWVTLDTRDTTLSDKAEAPSGFAIPNPRVFRYLRLQFTPQFTDSMLSSLSEIEFYPSPR